ncbi:hypothetical protein AVEN_200876-1 [Araneus ventricosus]|uniref:Uncharacterized protein n=1 Tax=Araneus ventricosus TaxID=182803 RepID=A0A4Y2VDP4_ARAVE|nr:hypothetical protein AVEN_200876-1 [Araneus ventricosus]
METKTSGYDLDATISPSQCRTKAHAFPNMMRELKKCRVRRAVAVTDDDLKGMTVSYDLTPLNSRAATGNGEQNCRVKYDEGAKNAVSCAVFTLSR